MEVAGMEVGVEVETDAGGSGVHVEGSDVDTEGLEVEEARGLE